MRRRLDSLPESYQRSRPRRKDGQRIPMQSRVSSRWHEYLMEPFLLLSGLVSSLVVAAIFVFLIYFTIPIIASGDLLKLLSWDWRPTAGQHGILPMAIGSLYLGLSATLVAYPLGLGICCFTHSLGPRSIARLLMIIIDFMTSVPTVVYGFVSAFFSLYPFSGSASSMGPAFPGWLRQSP